MALTADHMAALLPTLSARRNPQVWYASTPPLEPAAFLVSLRDKAKAGARRLAYFEWSPPSDFSFTPKTLPLTDADRLMWEKCNPALHIRIDPEFVELERDTLPDFEFARERGGVWPPSAHDKWKVIGEGQWTRILDPASSVAGHIALAAEVSIDRTRGSVAIAGRRDDELIHVEVVQTDIGTGWMASYIARFLSKWKLNEVVIDVGGPGGSLVAELEAIGISVKKPTVRDVSNAYGYFYDSVAEMTMRHIGQPELTTALAGASRRPLGDSWTWARQSELVDISPLVAVTLATWGLVGSPVEAIAEPLVMWL